MTVHDKIDRPVSYQDVLDAPEGKVAEIVTRDWVCEIPSPSTARLDRLVNKPIYAKAGIVHLWLPDAEGPHTDAS